MIMYTLPYPNTRVLRSTTALNAPTQTRTQMKTIRTRAGVKNMYTSRSARRATKTCARGVRRASSCPARRRRCARRLERYVLPSTQILSRLAPPATERGASPIKNATRSNATYLYLEDPVALRYRCPGTRGVLPEAARRACASSAERG